MYSIIILVFLGGHVILWGFKPEILILDPESRTAYAVSGIFLVLMVIGVVLSWQIRKHSTLSCQEQSLPSPTIEQITSFTHQKINNNQFQALPATSSSSYIQMVTRPGTGRQIPGSFQ